MRERGGARILSGKIVSYQLIWGLMWDSCGTHVGLMWDSCGAHVGLMWGSHMGGFSLLAKLYVKKKKIELKENLESMFPVVEISLNSKGVGSKLIKFGLTVLAGGSRFSHTVFLSDSNDIYKRLFGLEKMVKSLQQLLQGSLIRLRFLKTL